MNRIYLAGPEVFLPEPLEEFSKIKDYAMNLGFHAYSPFDSEAKHEDLTGLDLARHIYRENIKLIENCDFILANCNAFRGALVDDGTSFEIGYAAARKKIIYGYITNRLTLPEIVATRIPLKEHTGVPQDEDGYLVNEDFGNSINLMMEFSIEESGGQLIEGDVFQALDVMAGIHR